MTAFKALDLPEVILETPSRLGDARGNFCETYGKPLDAANGISADFVRHNESPSAVPARCAASTCRRLCAQAKLVRVLSVVDVAVGVRKGSPSYDHLAGARLTAEGGEELFAPQGFAHGFCTLAPETCVAYKVDALYDRASEVGIV